MDEIRFWSKINVTNSNESCWYWKANTSHNFGYGSFRINGKTYSSHRLALMFYSGGIKDDLQANHKCNNPACCNPTHLYWGTQKENIRDSIIAGTKTDPPRNNPPILRGEDNPHAVMTEDFIRNLRGDWQSEVSAKKLSKKYNISINTVYQIVNYRSWKHVT